MTLPVIGFIVSCLIMLYAIFREAPYSSMWIKDMPPGEFEKNMLIGFLGVVLFLVSVAFMGCA
jgi:hypothetical protein